MGHLQPSAAYLARKLSRLLQNFAADFPRTAERRTLRVVRPHRILQACATRRYAFQRLYSTTLTAPGHSHLARSAATK